MKIRKPSDYSPKPSYIKMSTKEYNQGHNTGADEGDPPTFYGSSGGGRRQMEEAMGEDPVSRSGHIEKRSKPKEKEKKGFFKSLFE